MSDPVTRQEQLLSAIATGGDILSPVTREEMYLAYMAGDTSVVLPEPITRKEQFLYQACLNGGGGTEITDGIVVKARDADGYATEVDFYGDTVYPWTFGAGNGNGANTTNFSMLHVTTVNLKNTVTKLKAFAFAGATKLTTVNGLNWDEITEAGTTPIKFSYNWHFSAVLTKNIQISFANCGITSIEAREWTQVLNNCFSGCNALVTAKFPKATGIGTYTANCFKSCTALETAEFGSIGHGVTALRPDVFSNCTQSFLTVTAFCKGDFADTLLANIRNGATNATIIIKDSTTGETLVTSTP